MGCLYCGKEIGPIRILRDREFCTPAHRERYRERLGRALDRAGENQLQPPGLVDFAIAWPTREGSHRFAEFPPIFTASYPPLSRGLSSSISLAPLLTESAARLAPFHAEPPPQGVRSGQEIPVSLIPRTLLPSPPAAALWQSFEHADEPRPVAPRLSAPASLPVPPCPPAPAAIELRLSLPGPLLAEAEELAAIYEEEPPPCNTPVRCSSPAPAERIALPLANPAASSRAWGAPIPSRFDPPLPMASLSEGRFTLRHGTPAVASSPCAIRVSHQQPILNRPGPCPPALPAPRPGVETHRLWKPAPAPSPAEAELVPVHAEALAISPHPAALIGYPDFCDALEVVYWPLAGTAETSPPAAAESLPTVRFLPRPIAAARALRTPSSEFAPPGTRALPSAPACVNARPGEVGKPAKPSLLPSIATLRPTAPSPEVGRLPSGLPQPPLIPLRFYCARGVTRRASHRLKWMPRNIPAVRPPLTLRLAVERVEEVVRPQEKRKSKFAEIFSSSGIAHRRSSAFGRDAMKTIAASLVVGTMLWYGLNFIRQAPSLQRLPSLEAAASNHAGNPSGAASSGSADSHTERAGWATRLRRAIAVRAASDLNDTFHDGMANWGAAPKVWPRGWSRHPDGYVRPGQLALFQPSLSYTDYRVEFFGQIEQHAIDWAVRARDSRNYYAMKFAVVEPGLRPMIAMVHYSVVGGKRSRRITVPLSVMIHNNTPYHVAVDVRGNHIVTSIEGQEVDTWIDDTLSKGGVGFFAEAGERSRLYWVKVSRNQDFLGRICAILAGDTTGTQAAELWRWRNPLPHAPPGEPEQDSPALLGAGLYLFGRRRYRSHSSLKHWRFPAWNI